jgi:TIR domain
VQHQKQGGHARSDVAEEGQTGVPEADIRRVMGGQAGPEEEPTYATEADKPRKVFISHIEEEQGIASEIASGLEAAGHTVWYYERDSYPGPDYLDQVSNAIEDCQIVLVLISPESLKHHQVEDEVKWARELRKHFLPVLHGMTWSEFQRQRAGLRMALGIAAGIEIPDGGVDMILPRVLKGLERLGS